MFSHTKERMADQEVERLKSARNRLLFKRLLRKDQTQYIIEKRSVDAYRIAVSQCFILPDFNEELPLYFLDLGGMVLVLFGQWMFDPHILHARKEVFDAWKCDEAFFGSFSLRCLADCGIVFELAVQGSEFVKAQRLPSALKFKKLHECQFIAGNGATLVSDFEKKEIR